MLAYTTLTRLLVLVVRCFCFRMFYFSMIFHGAVHFNVSIVFTRKPQTYMYTIVQTQAYMLIQIPNTQAHKTHNQRG